MYEITITVLVAVGLIASSIYVMTWTPGAIKSRLKGHTSLTPWEIVDFGALPWGCFIILMLSVINLVDSGVPIPQTTGLMIQRIFTAAFITGIVLLRLVRWALTYRDATPADRRSGAVAGHRRPKGRL